MIKKLLSVLLTLVTCTAYTASVEECGNSNGITASGTRAIEGRTVAADHLPFGTRVIIDGHEYVVEDRFGAGYTDRIDIYMEDVERAWEFGRQIKEVKVIL